MGNLQRKFRQGNAINTLSLQVNMGEMSLKINKLRREINELLDDEETYWG